MSVAGMKILVTGASSGIGAHVARFLVDAGAEVAVAARRAEALEAMAKDAGPMMHPVAIDVSDPESVSAGVAKAAEIMGGLNGLFANAGTSWGGPAVAMPEEDWNNVIDVNVSGVFRSCRAAAPIMAEGGGGSMVATASILGFLPGPAVAAYATSKAAVVHMVKNLALEWAPMNIRVNAVAPGYFMTEMTTPFLDSPKQADLVKNVPMRRVGDLHELNAPLELLLGSGGSFITGATLPVDGGHQCQSV